MVQRILFIFLLFTLTTPLVYAQKSAEPENKRVIENDPQFPGGEIEFYKFITEHLQQLYEDGVVNADGKVVIQFTIDTSGMAGSINVLQSLNDTLDRACMQIIKSMPKWVPGKYFDRILRPCTYNIPFNFVDPKNR